MRFVHFTLPSLATVDYAFSSSPFFRSDFLFFVGGACFFVRVSLIPAVGMFISPILVSGILLPMHYRVYFVDWLVGLFPSRGKSLVSNAYHFG